MKLIKIGLAILLTANASVVLGQTSGAAVPNIFTSGERAIAADVNENFQELADRIQGQSLVYDYKDYFIPDNVIQKVFDVNTDGCGDVETRTYTRTSVAGGTEISQRRVKIEDETGENCSTADYTFLATPSQFLRTGLITYDVLNQVLTIRREREYTNAILRTNNMERGKKILNVVDRSDIIPSDDPNEVIESITTYQTEIVGIEDVTVPAGTYSECIKSEYKWGANANIYMLWFCKDVGLVKSSVITSGFPLGAEIKELRRIIATP